MENFYATRLARWVILFSTLAACDPPAEREKAEPENVKAPLLNFFEAIKARDLDAMKANTTDDFVIFEDGRVWSNDSLWAALERNPGRRMEFKLTGFKVFVDRESGHISYFNHADVYHMDTLSRQVDWLENVTLRKVDGKWKLNFLQSSPRK